jgi:hypothetical protein
MEDKYEKLVRWYLRFNGYLTAENYVVHEARNGKIPQGGEFDTLAVRFPYSREQVDQKVIKNDPNLEDAEVSAHHLVDFVIAEVKSGKRNRLNSIWQSGNEKEKVSRIAYILRWIGTLGDEQRTSEVARRLQKEHRARENGYLFRLVYFSKSHTQQGVPAIVPQITFREIAEFIVRLRTPCWQRFGMGVRSYHTQWDKMICDIWDIGDPENHESEGEKVQRILALLSENS